MIYTNIELEYAECDFCGQEKKCFIQHEFGVKQAVCPDCFSIADCN